MDKNLLVKDEIWAIYIVKGEIFARILLSKAKYGPESYRQRRKMDQNLIYIGEILTIILLSKVEYGPEYYCPRRKMDGLVAKARAI